tara:strand:+ start:5316 stop:5558 length:243 start_codon:yes stop_codon:yes gene_type:complete
MKAYRIQARVGDYYLDHKLEAENDRDALNKFSKAVDSGTVKTEDEGFYGNKDGSRVYITYEEIVNVEPGKDKVVERTSTP